MSNTVHTGSRASPPPSKKRKISDANPDAVKPAPTHVYTVQSYYVDLDNSDHGLHSIHYSAAAANRVALQIYNEHSLHYEDIDAIAIIKPIPEEPIVEAYGPESIEINETDLNTTGKRHWPRLRKDGGLRLGGSKGRSRGMCVVWVQRWSVNDDETILPATSAASTVRNARPEKPVTSIAQQTPPRPPIASTGMFANIELAHDDGVPGFFKAFNANTMRAYAEKQKQPGAAYPIQPLLEQQVQPLSQASVSRAQASQQQSPSATLPPPPKAATKADFPVELANDEGSTGLFKAFGATAMIAKARKEREAEELQAYYERLRRNPQDDERSVPAVRPIQQESVATQDKPEVPLPSTTQPPQFQRQDESAWSSYTSYRAGAAHIHAIQEEKAKELEKYYRELKPGEDRHWSPPPMHRAWLPPHVKPSVIPARQQDGVEVGGEREREGKEKAAAEARELPDLSRFGPGVVDPWR